MIWLKISIIDFYSFSVIPVHILANMLNMSLVFSEVIGFDGYHFLYHFKVSENLTVHFVKGGGMGDQAISDFRVYDIGERTEHPLRPKIHKYGIKTKVR